MMLKLKLQYFGHLMWRVDSLEKPWCWKGLRAGEGDDRGWDGWMASPTRWTWVWVNSVSWWWTESPGVLGFTGSQRVGHDWVTELNWTVYWINAWKSHWLNPSKASKQTGRVSFSDDGDPKGSSLFPDPVPRFLGWKGHTAFQLFSKNLYPPLVLNGPETSFISDHPADHSS